MDWFTPARSSYICQKELRIDVEQASTSSLYIANTDGSVFENVCNAPGAGSTGMSVMCKDIRVEDCDT